MGVSRLDSFKLLIGQAGNTTGALTATEFPLLNYPVNGQVSVIMSGTFGGGTASLEVFDGNNWVPVISSPTSLTAPGVLVYQGAALGVRVKLIGSTNPSLNATAVMVDMY